MQKNQITINRFKVKGQTQSLEKDCIAVEEPLQIDLCQGNFQQTYIITMRTPGEDQLLTYGLLFTEGVIKHADEVNSMTTSAVKGEIEANLIISNIAPRITLDLKDKMRRIASFSGCGICGKTSLKALALKNFRKQKKIKSKLTTNDIKQMRNLLARQSLFCGTGGSHVAGIVYETEEQGKNQLDFNNALCFEDVGRHNALDKLIGYELLNNDLNKAGILVLSGRIGFELVQKVVMAGFSTIVALGAPSSLAIKAANQFGVILIGFAKEHKYNLYTL